MVLKLASKQLEVQLNTSTTTAPPFSAKTDRGSILQLINIHEHCYGSFFLGKQVNDFHMPLLHIL
jgi:hypothetical protein